RHVLKDRLYSFIKIAGLALGIALFILFIAFVLDERGYDRFHERAGRIHMLTSSLGGGNRNITSTPFLGSLIKQEFPEVVRAARYWETRPYVQAPNGEILEQRIILTDPAFFDIFTVPVKAGLAARALDGPDGLVLRAATAAKLFGSADPLGKTLTIRLGSVNKEFIVRGVLGEFPGPSSLRFDMLMSFVNYPLLLGEEFSNSIIAAPFFHTTFLELQDGAQAAALEAKFPAFLQKYYGQEYEKTGLDPDFIRLGLTRLLDYHLGEGTVARGGDLAPRSRSSYSLNLFGIALVVLFLASFNHVNLSLGQASTRMKEIGIRKVVGAWRSQLLVQFLADSLLLSVLASALALGLAMTVLPAFNALMGKSLDFGFLLRWPTLLLFPTLIVMIAVLAGLWPAAVLSRLEATDIFRGKLKLGGHTALTRLLVVLQFAASVFLIVMTLTMNRQLRFMTRADVGFDRENLIAVPTHAGWLTEASGEATLAAFENALRGQTSVLSVAGATGTVEGLGFGGGYPLEFEGRRVVVASRRVTHDFLRTMGLRLTQGRDFSRTIPTDVAEAVVVNETFVRRFNLRDPVGKRYSEFALDPRPLEFRYDPQIIGVVKDYHFSSLRDEIAPLALDLSRDDPIIHVLVRSAPGRAEEALALLRESWSRMNPSSPFTYVFLSDALAGQYAGETTWRRVMGLATGFALFIAAIGLVGLSALAAARRTKEIGIRKTVGGSVWDIVVLMSREYLVLIGAANLLAWPAAYFVARHWMQNYAFRAGINPLGFVFAAFLAGAAAAVALGYHAVRTAAANPVDALRYE
ncbi:MAG: ABC transporter permease, partial [Candidatus Aminicenantes bacterium]|nr:ABC transporter permease [Candidatus Aminicenantes bacterium]